MSQSLYPVRPVITTDANFAQAYNSHPASAMMVSACLTPREAEALIARGAVFESVHLMDGAGEELFQSKSAGLLVHRLSTKSGVSVEVVHRMLRAELLEAGMG